jgi:hypothetical protein
VRGPNIRANQVLKAKQALSGRSWWRQFALPQLPPGLSTVLSEPDCWPISPVGCAHLCPGLAKQSYALLREA